MADDPRHSRVFSFTKKIHNVLQGEPLEIAADEKALYEQVAFENATRLHLDGVDAVIVHDPQPLAVIGQFTDQVQPWIWQCHLDMYPRLASRDKGAIRSYGHIQRIR